jgi:hypothetical protein
MERANEPTIHQRCSEEHVVFAEQITIVLQQLSVVLPSFPS